MLHRVRISHNIRRRSTKDTESQVTKREILYENLLSQEPHIILSQFSNESLTFGESEFEFSLKTKRQNTHKNKSSFLRTYIIAQTVASINVTPGNQIPSNVTQIPVPYLCANPLPYPLACYPPTAAPPGLAYVPLIQVPPPALDPFLLQGRPCVPLIQARPPNTPLIQALPPNTPLIQALPPNTPLIQAQPQYLPLMQPYPPPPLPYRPCRPCRLDRSKRCNTITQNTNEILNSEEAKPRPSMLVRSQILQLRRKSSSLLSIPDEDEPSHEPPNRSFDTNNRCCSRNGTSCSKSRRSCSKARRCRCIRQRKSSSESSSSPDSSSVDEPSQPTVRKEPSKRDIKNKNEGRGGNQILCAGSQCCSCVHKSKSPAQKYRYYYIPTNQVTCCQTRKKLPCCHTREKQTSFVKTESFCAQTDLSSSYSDTQGPLCVQSPFSIRNRSVSDAQCSSHLMSSADFYTEQRTDSQQSTDNQLSTDAEQNNDTQDQLKYYKRPHEPRGNVQRMYYHNVNPQKQIYISVPGAYINSSHRASGQYSQPYPRQTTKDIQKIYPARSSSRYATESKHPAHYMRSYDSRSIYKIEDDRKLKQSCIPINREKQHCMDFRMVSPTYIRIPPKVSTPLCKPRYIPHKVTERPQLRALYPHKAPKKPPKIFQTFQAAINLDREQYISSRIKQVCQLSQQNRLPQKSGHSPTNQSLIRGTLQSPYLPSNQQGNRGSMQSPRLPNNRPLSRDLQSPHLTSNQRGSRGPMRRTINQPLSRSTLQSPRRATNQLGSRGTLQRPHSTSYQRLNTNTNLSRKTIKSHLTKPTSIQSQPRSLTIGDDSFSSLQCPCKNQPSCLPQYPCTSNIQPVESLQCPCTSANQPPCLKQKICPLVNQPPSIRQPTCISNPQCPYVACRSSSQTEDKPTICHLSARRTTATSQLERSFVEHISYNPATGSQQNNDINSVPRKQHAITRKHAIPRKKFQHLLSSSNKARGRPTGVAGELMNELLCVVKELSGQVDGVLETLCYGKEDDCACSRLICND